MSALSQASAMLSCSAGLALVPVHHTQQKNPQLNLKLCIHRLEHIIHGEKVPDLQWINSQRMQELLMLSVTPAVFLQWRVKVLQWKLDSVTTRRKKVSTLESSCQNGCIGGHVVFWLWIEDGYLLFEDIVKKYEYYMYCITTHTTANGVLLTDCLWSIHCRRRL